MSLHCKYQSQGNIDKKLSQEKPWKEKQSSFSWFAL